MATLTTPTYLGNTAGNIHTAASLGNGATANDNYDGSAVLETQVHVKCVFGTVSATNGVKVEVFRRYGATPTTAETAFLTYTIPGTGSTTVTLDFFLSTGKYNIKLTNLDATNAVNPVEVTGDQITNLSTA